jgi:hypothetical protein
MTRLGAVLISHSRRRPLRGPTAGSCSVQAVRLNQCHAGRVIHTADDGGVIARHEISHNRRLQIVRRRYGGRDDFGFLIAPPIVIRGDECAIARVTAKSRGKLESNVKYWEIIADRLSKSGWSWGCVAVVNDEGRVIFVVDAHRDDGKRYVVRSDEKLTAFLETEKVTRDSPQTAVKVAIAAKARG